MYSNYNYTKSNSFSVHHSKDLYINNNIKPKQRLALPSLSQFSNEKILHSYYS